MANGYFERGEMYDILFSDGFEGEMSAHRPGIIVSSDKGNVVNPSVLMVYTTTTTANRRLSVNHEFTMNGWKNFALCNQIVTVNKNRLKKFYGKLPQSDMSGIDKCLQEAMSLDFVDETALKEKDNEIKSRDVLIDDLRSEMAGVKAEVDKKDGEIAKRDDEIASLKMEIEMWQKCYGRCMDMLVDTKVNADLSRRVTRVVEAPVATKVEEPKVEEPKVEEPSAPEPEEEKPQEEKPQEESPKLDINSCTITALKKAGIMESVATKIVGGRPWKSVEDLRGTVGMKATTFGIVKEKLCCVPVVKSALVEADPGFDEGSRVDINVASAAEIHEVTGVNISACYAITGGRKKNGPYQKIEELLNLHGFYRPTIEKMKDKITISGVIPELAPVEEEEDVKEEESNAEKPVPELSEKVNINTAKGKELMTKLGINEAYAYSITSHRNKNGPYTSLEELKHVKGVPSVFYERYKDYLEV